MRATRHALLKAGTADAHNELERAVDLIGYFDALPRYRDYLTRMLSFHRRLDRAAGEHGDLLSRWSIDRHALWLAADLDALGVAPVAHPDPAAGWRLSTCGHVLGALYVVVGSSLGARLLLRRTQSLPLPAGAGRGYLEGLARTTDWAGFLAALESIAADPQDLLAGARSTFAAVHSHLTEPAIA